MCWLIRHKTRIHTPGQTSKRLLHRLPLSRFMAKTLRVYTKFKRLIKTKKYRVRHLTFWSWRVCKQAKLSHLGHRKPARIHWKLGNFLRKRTRRGGCSQWRSLSGHVELIFVHKNSRGGYWQHLVSTERRYVPHSWSHTRYFASCFWRSHYQPQSWCCLATSGHRWTIICGLPSKMSVRPTSQRQLTL